jgi:hypothetical protein
VGAHVRITHRGMFIYVIVLVPFHAATFFSRLTAARYIIPFVKYANSAQLLCL